MTEMEDFKRPNHPDFMLSSELKAMNWSGVRINSLNGYKELWVEGHIRFEMRNSEAEAFPDRWEEGYAVAFGLIEAKLDKRSD